MPHFPLRDPTRAILNLSLDFAGGGNDREAADQERSWPVGKHGSEELRKRSRESTSAREGGDAKES